MYVDTYICNCGEVIPKINFVRNPLKASVKHPCAQLLQFDKHMLTRANAIHRLLGTCNYDPRSFAEHYSFSWLPKRWNVTGNAWAKQNWVQCHQHDSLLKSLFTQSHLSDTASDWLAPKQCETLVTGGEFKRHFWQLSCNNHVGNLIWVCWAGTSDLYTSIRGKLCLKKPLFCPLKHIGI